MMSDTKPQPQYESPAAEEIQPDGDPAETCAAVTTNL
jgi:hypothetical protein